MSTISTTTITTHDFEISQSNTNSKKIKLELENNQCELMDENKNEKIIKDNNSTITSSIQSSPLSLQLNTNNQDEDENNENDIDVEAFSDHVENSNDSYSSVDDNDDVRSPFSIKDNNSTFNKTPSPAHSISSSSSSSSHIKKMESSASPKLSLKNDDSKEILDINKKSLYSNEKVSQERSAPILVNGKKYYRKFLILNS